jgi:hypothetical protein
VSGLTPLLSDQAVLELLIRLGLGALASFLAIASWTRTRDLYWVFVIAGILANYAGTLYRAIRSFGLLTGPEVLVRGVPLGTLISDNLSILCFIVACALYLRTYR